MRISTLAASLGKLGAMTSLVVVLSAPFLTWKTLNSHVGVLGIAAVNLSAFGISLCALILERDATSAKIAWRCFTFVLLAILATLVTLFFELGKHPV